MIKKEYMTPAIEELECEMAELLAGSGVSSDDIGWGGVDEEGTLDPNAPMLPDMSDIVILFD